MHDMEMTNTCVHRHIETKNSVLFFPVKDATKIFFQCNNGDKLKTGNGSGMRSFEHLNEFSLKEDCEDSKQKERRIESKRERKKNMKHV